MINPKWHDIETKKAEAEWQKRLEIIGGEKVRELLLAHRVGETLALPIPVRATDPLGGREWQIDPPVHFVVNWLDAERKQTREKEDQRSVLTTRIQFLALAISFLGTLAILLNVLRAYLGGPS